MIARAGWIIVGGTYRFNPIYHNFSFGWEMGRLGEAIASGRGFSDPFDAHTGATAWESPLYPYLIAGTFHVFGIYSQAAAFVLLIPKPAKHPGLEMFQAEARQNARQWRTNALRRVGRA